MHGQRSGQLDPLWSISKTLKVLFTISIKSFPIKLETGSYIKPSSKLVSPLLSITINLFNSDDTPITSLFILFRKTLSKRLIRCSLTIGSLLSKESVVPKLSPNLLKVQYANKIFQFL